MRLTQPLFALLLIGFTQASQSTLPEIEDAAQYGEYFSTGLDEVRELLKDPNTVEEAKEKFKNLKATKIRLDDNISQSTLTK